jgi:predicted phage terminase large subunit-like protein
MSHLDAAAVEGFSDQFLIDGYDERRETPELHRKWWAHVTSNYQKVAIAGPRKHAKSTALNHCYGLAASLSQQHPFQIKICDTYERACEKLEQAKIELTDNQRLKSVFQLKRLLRDRENDIICEMVDGYRFRMMAMGRGQAARGMTFGTVRPTLIQLDDIEDAEDVLDVEHRNKLMRWLQRTIQPMLADRGQIRVYGTILHNDSVLARLMKMKTWKSYRYEACDAEISEASILWPDKFPKHVLEDIKQGMVDDPEGNGLEGFNMEYRNLAVNYETSFFRPSDFRAMDELDYKRTKLFYVGGDLAYSKNQGRDYSVFTVGGIDEEGTLHIVDERRGRWDGKQVIDEMYAIEEAWHPEEWFIESGAIMETLGAALEIRMREDGYLNLCPGLVPTRDKAIRAVPLQARMRNKGIKWDTEASWFAEHKAELLEFTQAGTRGRHDDRVDADAWLAQGIKRMMAPPSEQETEEEEYRMARRERDAFTMAGRSSTTGY